MAVLNCVFFCTVLVFLHHLVLCNNDPNPMAVEDELFEDLEGGKYGNVLDAIWAVNARAPKEIRDRLIEGDILLPEGMTRDGHYQQLREQRRAKLSGGGVCLGCNQWPWDAERQKYVVPYSLLDHYREDQRKDIIMWAFRFIESGSNIQFIERTTEVDYIYFYNSTGCWSMFGRRGGPQELSLTDDNIDSLVGCMHRGTVIHELFHALGLGHEHQRPDRDDWLDVHLENVLPNSLHDLQMYTWLDGGRVSPYDYASIMHYDSLAFTRFPNNASALVLEPKNKSPETRRIVDIQKPIPSSCDWLEISYLYPGAVTVDKCTPHELLFYDSDCPVRLDCDARMPPRYKMFNCTFFCSDRCHTGMKNKLCTWAGPLKANARNSYFKSGTFMPTEEPPIALLPLDEWGYETRTVFQHSRADSKVFGFSWLLISVFSCGTFMLT